MRVILIGASGMVGQGVLRACLQAADVTEIVVLGRRALSGYDDPRLTVVTVPDLAGFVATDAVFSNIDACFFCAGVSSLGMAEADYRKVTYDLTLHVAQQLRQRNAGLTMVYVSGAGADSSEQSKTMWARVRGQTENALQRLLPGKVAIFRPSVIIPEDGIQSATAVYRWVYIVLRPLLGPIQRLWPGSVLSTRTIGNAMLHVARRGVTKAVLIPADIQQLAAQAG